MVASLFAASSLMPSALVRARPATPPRGPPSAVPMVGAMLLTSPFQSNSTCHLRGSCGTGEPALQENGLGWVVIDDGLVVVLLDLAERLHQDVRSLGIRGTEGAWPQLAIHVNGRVHEG